MTLRSYLIMMIIATIFCWGAFLFILWTVNPYITNWLGFTLFYGSLFLATSGAAAIIGFVIRFVALRHELAWRSVSAAFRQSFIFATLIVVTLILLAQDLFTWLNLVLLIIGLSVLEYFLISYNSRNVNRVAHNAEIDNFNHE